MSSAPRASLPRRIGLVEALAVVIGTTIGSGIFRSPAAIANRVPSPPVFMAVWMVGGALALCGALTLAEVASAIPRTGGIYAILRDGWGELLGFLFGWSELVVIRAAALGAVSMTFAEYVLGLAVPHLDAAARGDMAHYVAAVAIVIFAALNIIGVRWSTLFLAWTSLAKYGALLFLVGAALVVLPGASYHAVWHVAPASHVTVGAFGIALVSVLWAYDGWADLSFIAGEVTAPARTLPRALIGGTLAVIAIYVAVNVAYLAVLPIDQMRRSPLVAADVAQRLLGIGGSRVVAVAVILATIGTLNAALLTAPRIFFAMADDGLLLRRIAAVHPRYRTPYVAIGLSAVLGVGFVLLRTFDQLADTFITAIVPFYALAVAAVFPLRRRALYRPSYRVHGYPIVPALFVLAASFVLASALAEPTTRWPTLAVLGVVVAGVPVYYVVRRARRRILPLLGLLLWCGLMPARARAQGVPPATYCPVQGGDSTTSAALDCMVLVPVPRLPGASGVVALQPAHSPFGVAVTANGSPRYHLAATIAGLPTPRSLGHYTVYIAWAYTSSLDSAVKLGTVHNGRVDLGELDYVQFRILISAERSAATAERTGPLVLRGTSPSMYLLAHRDFVQPSAPGALRDAAPGTMDPMTMMRGAEGGAMTHWIMPPTPVWMPTMPGLAGLVPRAEPFLPAANPDSGAIPTARPGEIVRLASGDTLDLEAGLVKRTIAGRTLTMYGFNGQYPGPLVEVPQAATIVVRYHNALDQPSTVHWHGVRLDNRFDGAAGVTQPAVAPGGRFVYTVHVPDAGIYWYHPHVREDVQQNLGLYGNVLVRSPRSSDYGPVNREQILMLSDLLIGPDGLVPYGTGTPIYALMGRLGNVLLVNGEPRYTLDVQRGEVVRFFLTNASNARLYNLSFIGARMKVVAADLGRFEHEEWVRSVVIAPAQRYVVDVQFARSGTAMMLNRVLALNHLSGSYTPEIDTLGAVRVAREPVPVRDAERFRTLRYNRDVSAEIAPFRKYFAKPVDHALVLTMRTRDLPAAIENMLTGINARADWNDGMPMMNWLMTGNEVTWVLRDPATGKENMDIDWHFHQGDVVKLRLFNDPSTRHAMDHPIHLHGQRFLVLSRDGVPNTNLVWKDTALIPAGETVDLLVDMSNPGRWMLHCHIAEHLGAGMMSVFTVEPRAGAR